MNILFVSHTAGNAGAETVLLNVIKTIADNKNCKIFIALPNDGNDAFIKGLGEVANNCVIERFAFRPIRNTMMLLSRNLGYGILLGLPKLVRFIKKNQIDIVYVNSGVNVIGTLAARKAGCRYIWHIHEQSTTAHRWWPKWFNHFYQKWLNEPRCKSIFVSNTSYKLWLDDLGIDQIPNAEVLYSLYKPIENTNKIEHNPFTFGYIGSLNANKNVGRLIKAFDALPQDSKLIIGGSGEHEKDLKEQANENPNIVFLGQITHLNHFYPQIDCLVLPSLNESWGLVVLEAISAGVPVICTQNTGLTELLTDQKECVFINPIDVAQITDAMNKIKNNSAFRQSLINNASKTLTELNINEHFTTRILEIINEAKK